jgi:ankyrin repeat protein
MELLLATCHVDVDYRSAGVFGGRTPLPYAAGNGHEAAVGLLLDTESVYDDSKDGHGRTPLSYAAEGGHNMVVGLLLAADAVDPNSRDTKPTR